MPAAQSPKVRTRLPLSRRWSIQFKQGNGEPAELDLVWATPEGWRRLPQSRVQGWRVLPVGPFLLAVKVLV